MWLNKQRNESVVRRAKEMHDECMKDPEYTAKWKALTTELFGLLADLPPDACHDDPVGTEDAMYETKIAACQCCGTVAELHCGASRFGPETWACVECWNPGDGPAPNCDPVVPNGEQGGAK